MKSQMKWSIGKEATPEGRLDTPPYRAYIQHCRDDGRVSLEDYSQEELELEISRRRQSGEAVDQFLGAQRALEAANRGPAYGA